jgi:hypothetical protein
VWGGVGIKLKYNKPDWEGFIFIIIYSYQ